MFSEENVSANIVNPAIQAMKVVQAEMAGEAEKANLISEEDILRFVKEVRNSENRSVFPNE
jgi:hypothetical protein